MKLLIRFQGNGDGLSIKNSRYIVEVKRKRNGCSEFRKKSKRCPFNFTGYYITEKGKSDEIDLYISRNYRVDGVSIQTIFIETRDLVRHSKSKLFYAKFPPRNDDGKFKKASFDVVVSVA